MRKPFLKPVLLAAFGALVLAASPAEETVHVVEAGETLNGIATRAGVAASAIAKINGLKAPFPLRLGQKLTIPRAAAKAKPTPASTPPTAASSRPVSKTSHIVEPGETLGGIANRAGVSLDAIARANSLSAPFPLRAGQKLAIPRGQDTTASKPPSSNAASAAALVPNGQEGDESGHVVKSGETLGGIANRAGVPQILIAEANGLAEPYSVQAGQKLLIPRARNHIVAEGETGFGIAYQYGVPWPAIATANAMDPDDTVRSGQKLVIPTITKIFPRAPAVDAARSAPDFQWPLHGDTLLGFVMPTATGGHNGIDLAANMGTAVKAAESGKVVFAGNEPKLSGNLVVIDHGNKWHSAYGHLASSSVKVGDHVDRGAVIGKVGQSGKANRPALHFEIRRNNLPIDPARQLSGSSGP
jgi:murein DD-endopeptidase MepM/ murein hydrolase activator NlpD